MHGDAQMSGGMGSGTPMPVFRRMAIAKHFLKFCRGAALMLFGAATFSAAILATTLYLLRNSNLSFVSGDFELDPNAGSVVFWRISNPNQHLKLDKADLTQLIGVTSVCFLAWLIYMVWPLSLRRRPRGAFPVQLSRQAAEPIAVEPLRALPLDGPATIWGNMAVLAASPRLRRSRRTVLWCTLAAWLIWVILSLMRAEPPTAAQQKSILDAEESKYMAAEGHLRRGKAFEAVASRVMVMAASPDGKRFTWSEAQQYLGPPNLYDGPMDRPNGVVYLYDRYAKKDWGVFVLFDSQGKTRYIGVNATVANSLAGWSTYPTTSPATVPVNAEP